MLLTIIGLLGVAFIALGGCVLSLATVLIKRHGLSPGLQVHWMAIVSCILWMILAIASILASLRVYKNADDPNGPGYLLLACALVFLLKRAFGFRGAGVRRDAEA